MDGSICTSRCCPPGAGRRPCSTRSWRGDEITGASTFLIEEGLDSGPVYGTVTEEVRATDTSGDLLTRLAFAGAGTARRDDGRDRGRQPEGRTAAGGRRHPGAEDQRRGRARGLERARAPGRPGRTRVHARAGGVDRLPRGAAQVDPGRARFPSGRISRRGCWPSARTTCTSAPGRTPSSCCGCRLRGRSRCGRRTGLGGFGSGTVRWSGAEGSPWRAPMRVGCDGWVVGCGVRRGWGRAVPRAAEACHAV